MKLELIPKLGPKTINLLKKININTVEDLVTFYPFRYNLIKISNINDIKENIKEDEKKMSRRKNFKIVRLYIYILLLMAGSIFLIYKLYVTGNLDVVKDIKISTTTTTTTTALVKDLKWYMNKYGNILDNIKIDNVSLLKGNYDISKIDVKDKLAIAYNNLSSDSITKDGMIYSVKEEDLKKYQKSSSYEDLVSKYNTLKNNVSEAESRIKEHNDKVIMLDKENKIKDGRMFKMDFDPRIIGNKILPDGTKKTGIGEFIRKTSLDEFPQFYNVLKGDMSVVGPRPERPYFVEEFKEKIPKYMVKHQVKPGLTGWAQIHGCRGNTSIKKRIEFDIEYVENWHMGLDLAIMIKTAVKRNPNAY